MQQHISRLTTFTALLGVALLLVSCAHQTRDYIGETVAPAHAFKADSGSGQWETNDLKLMYTAGGGSSFLEGTLRFDSYLRYSFPLVEKFRLTIFFLDENRTVIANRDISPLIGYRRNIPERVALPTVTSAPPGTRYFTFSYWGFFSGNNNSDENTGDWEIYFDPFGKGM